jgi:hypothetical protein
MGEFQAKTVSIASQSSTKVLVSDVVLKVDGVTVASDDGALLNDGTIDHILNTIRQSPKRQILTFDVLREYSWGHSISAMSDSSANAQDSVNSNDQIHASRHYDGRRLSSNTAASGLKTTGLNDSADETSE